MRSRMCKTHLTLACGVTSRRLVQCRSDAPHLLLGRFLGGNRFGRYERRIRRPDPGSGHPRPHVVIFRRHMGIRSDHVAHATQGIPALFSSPPVRCLAFAPMGADAGGFVNPAAMDPLTLWTVRDVAMRADEDRRWRVIVRWRRTRVSSRGRKGAARGGDEGTERRRRPMPPW